MAQQLKCNKVLVQIDYKGVVVVVFICRKEDINIFSHIRALLSSVHSCMVSFVNRVCNKPTDMLAQVCLKEYVV